MIQSSPPGRWLIKSGSVTLIENRDVLINNKLVVDTNTFYVDDTNNRIGIGTTGPNYLIQARSGTDERFTVRRGVDFGAGYSGVAIDSLNDADTVRNMLVIGGSPIVLSSGNVGIGTTSPSYKLDVSNDGAVGATVNVTRLYANAASTAAARLVFGTFANPTGVAAISGQAVTATTGRLILETGSTERMRIDENGNIGIGTTGPANLLDIARKLAIESKGHILASRDTTGTVTITAGNTTAIVTYDNTYSVAPYVQLTPTTNLGTLSTGSQWWVNSSAGSFVANIAPVGGAATFNYFVIGSMV